MWTQVEQHIKYVTVRLKNKHIDSRGQAAGKTKDPSSDPGTHATRQALCPPRSTQSPALEEAEAQRVTGTC